MKHDTAAAAGPGTPGIAAHGGPCEAVGHEAGEAHALEHAASHSARKLLGLLALAAALFALMHWTPWGERVRDWQAYYELLADGSPRAALYFVLLTASLMAIGMPRLLFYALGGFAFGFVGGLALSLCGSLLGSFVAFRVARWGGRAWLAERFGERRLFRHVVGTRPSAWAVALVRFLPISNAVINVGLALSRVGNGAFLAGTLIGFLPQGVIAVLVGSGVADDVAWEGAARLAAAAALVALMSVWVLRRRRRGYTVH
jgi:uncharacterized membrane protein YdjX (TVP38/TMEM64 family)